MSSDSTSVFGILNIALLLASLKGTCHNQQTSQRVMETFLSSEGNYIITERIAQFLLSVTTRLMSLFLFSLRDVLSCYLSPLLYQFTFAAVTNYYRSNTSQKSNTCLTELKSQYWQGCIFSSRVKGRINFLNFPSFQKLPSFLGLLAPSIFKASGERFSCPLQVSSASLYHLKGPYDYIGLPG